MRLGDAATVMVVICACNPVFGLDPTQAIDASLGLDAPDANPDRDGDGIPNEQDVCPDLETDSQHDEDNDGSGDACDSCPLDPGTSGDVDADRIDDACDPGPQAHCLALFDSFATYAATDWNTVAGTTVTPGTDHIRVEGTPRGGVSPKGIAGEHSIRFRASVVAVDATGYIGIMGSTTVNNTDAGFQCRVLESELLLVNVAFGPTPMQPIAPSLAASESIVVAMTRGGQPETFGCRVERMSGTPGLSAAIQQSGAGASVAITTVGSASVLLLDNLAVYAERGTGLCPAPVIR